MCALGRAGEAEWGEGGREAAPGPPPPPAAEGDVAATPGTGGMLTLCISCPRVGGTHSHPFPEITVHAENYEVRPRSRPAVQDGKR